jgi:2-oxo-4-hydroxy-4-carboxy--5-ureidoimidazoline (OHCU) decarboxylase
MGDTIDPRDSVRARNYAMTKLAELHHDEYVKLNNHYRERMGLPPLQVKDTGK